MTFDARTDEIPVRDVPREAHRRFRADLQQRQDENRRRRAEQLAVHADKRRLVAERMATHVTADQHARQEAGVLSLNEAINGMTEQLFAPVADHRGYEHDGAARVQQYLRQSPRYASS